MKRTTRNIIIMLIALITLMISAITVSAAGTSVTKVDIKDDSAKLTLGPKAGTKASIGKFSFRYTGTKPTAKNFKWTSSNTTVAKVSSSGVVTAVGKGTATITLTAVNNKGKSFKVKNEKGQLVTVKDTCKITVRKEAHGAYYYLNNYRKKNKRAVLTRDTHLEKIALVRATEMAKTGKFSHTRPNGKSGLTLIKGNVHKGENIARGQVLSAAVSKAWYNSTGHRTNMLRKEFKKVGIACYVYKGTVYWAQVFSS